MHIKSETVNENMWERIYIDGNLVFEYPEVSARFLMRLLSEYTKEITYEFTEIQEDN
jgi:hypothetical protein